jgi:hypothetical protein
MANADNNSPLPQAGSFQLSAGQHDHASSKHICPGNVCFYPLQAGKWQFLFFKGTFDVRLHVKEHPQDRTVVFTLAESSFMQNFEGRWQVRQARGDAPA